MLNVNVTHLVATNNLWFHSETLRILACMQSNRFPYIWCVAQWIHLKSIQPLKLQTTQPAIAPDQISTISHISNYNNSNRILPSHRWSNYAFSHLGVDFLVSPLLFFFLLFIATVCSCVSRSIFREKFSLRTLKKYLYIIKKVSRVVLHQRVYL